MPALTSKRITLAEAAGLVPDGTRLALGGFAVYQKPMAFVRELVRQRRRELTVVGSAHSCDVDMLAGAGCLARVETSYVGLEKHGLARNFRRAAEAGALEVVDYPELVSLDRFRADQEGLAFWPVPFLGGNDVVTYNPDIRPMACPITGRPMHAVPAAGAKVAVIHAVAADEQGNVVIPARRLFPQSADIQVARSCDVVIVTAEKIVSRAFIRRHARLVEIPSYRTTAIVEVPFGAHPTPTLGRYLADERHMDDYVAASGDAGAFAAYLDTFVHAPRDHYAYLDLFGAERLAALQDLDSLL
ncbi:CoA transferase subunit A [Labrys wisconsinensis]|uniref:Glutaconate CoA-transferase subunit A n=1 Tax=Labrys wisconsinensis TaxID=425677 RepID=A0ABU0JM02_9HYPH|nr:CoA-transferase [Labrys wisconsinensis]MDQ0475309.1 glutaconate CoA-transferase subunit A [Labrys wisconsinensis]